MRASPTPEACSSINNRRDGRRQQHGLSSHAACAQGGHVGDITCRLSVHWGATQATCSWHPLQQCCCSCLATGNATWGACCPATKRASCVAPPPATGGRLASTAPGHGHKQIGPSLAAINLLTPLPRWRSTDGRPRAKQRQCRSCGATGSGRLD